MRAEARRRSAATSATRVRSRRNWPRAKRAAPDASATRVGAKGSSGRIFAAAASTACSTATGAPASPSVGSSRARRDANDVSRSFHVDGDHGVEHRHAVDHLRECDRPYAVRSGDVVAQQRQRREIAILQAEPIRQRRHDIPSEPGAAASGRTVTPGRSSTRTPAVNGCTRTTSWSGLRGAPELRLGLRRRGLRRDGPREYRSPAVRDLAGGCCRTAVTGANQADCGQRERRESQAQRGRHLGPPGE